MSNLEVTDDSSASEEFDGVKFENLRIENESVQIPEELCRNKEIFKEFFSLNTWNNLSKAVKEHLTSNFLPENLTSPQIQQSTITELFSGGLKRFTIAPMQKLQEDLEKGAYRKTMLKHKQKSIKRRRRKQRFLEHLRVLKLAKTLRKSKQNLLTSNESQAKLSKKLDCFESSEKTFNDIFQKSRKRYYSELSMVLREVGDDFDLSSDEESEIQKLYAMKKRQKRYLQSNV